MHLLETVISAGSLSLGDAAKALELPTSTALRHLKALELNGYLVRDDAGRFSAGPTFMRLALASLRDGPAAHLIAAAQPPLDARVETTHESAYLAVRDKSDAVYLSTAEGTRAIRHVGWVGRAVPLAGTAVGAALTNEGEPGEVHVNTGAAEPDVTAVCAPVHSGDGAVVAALSVLGPAHRLRGKQLTVASEAVVAATAAFSGELGGATQ